MAIGELLHRRDTTSVVSATTPKAGEFFINTDNWKPVIGDGSTPSGFQIDGSVVNAQVGTSYSVLQGDVGALVTFSNGSPVAVDLATPSGSYFPAQSRIWFLNLGAGLVTITPTASTVNGNASLDLAQYEGAIFISDGSDYFAIFTASPVPSPTSIVTITKTTNYSILSGDNGKRFNNIGAGGAVALALLPAVANFQTAGGVLAAQYLRFTADGTDVIHYGGTDSAPGGYIRSNQVGAFLQIEAHGTGEWIVSADSGSWSVDA